MFFALLIACADPTPPRSAPRWPRPGDAAVIEVTARLNEHGQATAWSAKAWTQGPEETSDTLEGCRVMAPTPAATGLAAVDVTAPSPTRLVADGTGSLETVGPLSVADARWAVGDASLLRDDGVRVDLPGAVRFGDAPDVLAVRDGLDGDVLVRWARTADERIEVETVRPDGKRMECGGGTDGVLVLPAYAVDPARPEVWVRAVRETISVAPNAAIVRVRAAVETVLSLADPVVSERAVAKPRPAKRTWEPRKVLRFRPNWG